MAKKVSKKPASAAKGEAPAVTPAEKDGIDSQLKKIFPIRNLVRSAYDLQKLRIQCGNRICANFRVRMGQRPGTKEKDIEDKENKQLLLRIRKEYRLMTDGLKSLPSAANFVESPLISSYCELCLINQYEALHSEEARHFRRILINIADEPIWKEYLKDVVGIGPALGGFIISEFNIHRAQYVSSLWKYSGLDVVDGEGRSRQKHHLIKVKYVNKDGEEAEKNAITFNPNVKTKMTGVLAGSLIRCGNPKYSPMYYDYKNRLENHEKHKEKSRGHRNRMALRYIAKAFLRDLYPVWRGLEGLPVHPPYDESKLGRTHHREYPDPRGPAISLKKPANSGVDEVLEVSDDDDVGRGAISA